MSTEVVCASPYTVELYNLRTLSAEDVDKTNKMLDKIVLILCKIAKKFECRFTNIYSIFIFLNIFIKIVRINKN